MNSVSFSPVLTERLDTERLFDERLDPGFVVVGFVLVGTVARSAPTPDADNRGLLERRSGHRKLLLSYSKLFSDATVRRLRVHTFRLAQVLSCAEAVSIHLLARESCSASRRVDAARKNAPADAAKTE